MIKTLVVAAALTVGLAGDAVTQQAPPAPPAHHLPPHQPLRRLPPRHPRPIARLAGALTAFALGVCAAGVGQGQAKARNSAGSRCPKYDPSRTSNTRRERRARRRSWKRRWHCGSDSLSVISGTLFVCSQTARRGSPLRDVLHQAAAAKLEAGDVYLMMSRYQHALAAYRQALTMSEGRVDQRCAALSRIARTYANIGRPHDSQQYSDQAVSVCMTISDKKAQADALEAQGETRFWSGNMTDAIASFTRARELASEAEDRDGEGLATMMLSQAVNHTTVSRQTGWHGLPWRASSNPVMNTVPRERA